MCGFSEGCYDGEVKYALCGVIQKMNNDQLSSWKSAYTVNNFELKMSKDPF